MPDTDDMDDGAEEYDGPQELSALENAMREAIAVVPPEDILDVIVRLFPRPPVSIDPEAFHGRVQKVSVSMPETLSAAIRDRTGPGGFSRFVAEAADKRLRHELLGEYLAELDQIYGPASPESIKQAKQAWRQFDEQ